MSKWNFKSILEKTGDVAEIAGDFTGNPLLKAGGQIIGAICDNDEQTSAYLEHMTAEQLTELNFAVAKVLKDKI